MDSVPQGIQIKPLLHQVTDDHRQAICCKGVGIVLEQPGQRADHFPVFGEGSQPSAAAAGIKAFCTELPLQFIVDLHFVPTQDIRRIRFQCITHRIGNTVCRCTDHAGSHINGRVYTIHKRCLFALLDHGVYKTHHGFRIVIIHAEDRAGLIGFFFL